VQGTCRWPAPQRGSLPRWIALARPAARAQFLLVAIAFGCLTWAFVANDFSVVYVAQHSNSRLPLNTASPAYGAAMRARCCCGC
jgi:cytochrome c biogenesis factor